MSETTHSVEFRNGTYYLLYGGAQVGYAKQLRGLWWWHAQLPGRRSGRKGFETPVACIASGFGIREWVVSELLRRSL